MGYGYIGRRLLTVLAAVMMIVSLIAAGLFFFSEYTEKRCTAETRGIITDAAVIRGNNTVSDQGGSRNHYTYTVEYSAGENQLSFEESASGNSFSRGDEVSVFYDPENPAVHYVKGIYFDSSSQLAGVKILLSFLPETAALFILLAAAESSESRAGRRLQVQ